MSETASETPNPVPTSTEAAHKHAVPAVGRAVVVGKCLKKATRENQEVEMLVDIAG